MKIQNNMSVIRENNIPNRITLCIGPSFIACTGRLLEQTCDSNFPVTYFRGVLNIRQNQYFTRGEGILGITKSGQNTCSGFMAPNLPREQY